METDTPASKEIEEPVTYQSTQEHFPEKNEDVSSDKCELNIQEGILSTTEETIKPISRINELVEEEQGDFKKIDTPNIVEDITIDNQKENKSTTTEIPEVKDIIKAEEKVSEVLKIEVNDSVTDRENKNTKVENQTEDKSSVEKNPNSEDVMDVEPSDNPETTKSSTTEVISNTTTNETSSKPQIKILSCDIIKPSLNSSNTTSVVNNSLGLSLVASEYASTEESEDSSSYNDSDSENEDSDFDSDESDENASSVQSTPRKAADSLDAIANEIELVTNSQAYRDQIVAVHSDTSSSDSSDVEIISQTTGNPEPIELDDDDEAEDDDNDGGRKGRRNKKQNGPVRVKGELSLEDLPPIEDLHITVPETECEEFGKIHSIVDQLVLVESKPEAILLDLDTVLFLEKGNKVLGKVFDVLGQVASPLYCIRFNSNKQVKERGIEIGQTVYVAPKTEHTQFLILTKLVSMRGSDASWENDVEPPTNHIDYSDDEQERSARRAFRNRHNNVEEDDNDEESSVQDDTESIQSDSTISSQRPRKRRFNQQRHSYGYQNFTSQQNQGYNYPSSYGFNQASPVPGYNQNYPGYNPNFNGNPPPLPGSPFYNSAYNSWHSNFNPYNLPPGHMQPPLFPPNQGRFRQPPPPSWNNQ